MASVGERKIVAARMRKEAELNARERIYEAMLKALEEVFLQNLGHPPATPLLAGRPDDYEEAVATRVLEVACETIGATGGCYFSFDDDTSMLTLLSVVGLLRDAMMPSGERLRVPAGEAGGDLGLSAASKRSMHFRSLDTYPDWIPASSKLRSAYLVPLCHGGRLLGVYAVGSDVEGWFTPERRVLADALVSYTAVAVENARLFAQAQRASERLSAVQRQLLHAQKMEAIGQLAGGLAHDLNNQLLVIRGCIELCYREPSCDSSMQSLIDQARKASDRAANLTRKMLLFSRKQPQNKTMLDLNSSVREIYRMLSRLMGEDVRTNLDLSADLWPVNADPTNIDQVITNLVINARDAMPSGGIITISTGNVVIDEASPGESIEARTGRFVRLSVSDTGTGIPDDVIPRLFEPFFTTKETGTGLGLSVTYGIVTAHDGWINVKSEVAKGSTFEVFLPAAPGAVSEGPAEPARPEPSAARGAGQRILLVEDEPGVIALAERVLAEHGYVVFPCRTIGEAFRVYDREGGKFDLVLSDVVLPDGRGPSLVAELRKSSPSLAVLLVSGYGNAAGRVDGAERGPVPFLQKPYGMRELLDKVAEVLMAAGGKASQQAVAGMTLCAAN
ncbi:MAG: response regulator [Firmicutes bacterium]|nr:response regulator [Bacillota bacterium]